MSFRIVEGEVRRVTDLAILYFTTDEQEVWIPRSVIDEGDAVAEGDTDIGVRRWFVEREGL